LEARRAESAYSAAMSGNRGSGHRGVWITALATIIAALITGASALVAANRGPDNNRPGPESPGITNQTNSSPVSGPSAPRSGPSSQAPSRPQAPPTLQLSSDSAQPGQTVQLAGTGFPGNSSVNITFQINDAYGTRQAALGSVTADSQGAFVIAAVVPANACSGRAQFVAAASGIERTADLEVLAGC
jgi:hypothetical protein